MNEDKRLRDKLARLSDAGDGRSAVNDDPLRALVLEIDETILPRRLTFRAVGGAELVLEVANRRLMAILDLPEDAGERATLLAPLPPDDDAALSAVAEALARFARVHGRATVTAVPLDRGRDPTGMGRPASAVAGVLGIDLYDRPVPVRMPDTALGFAPGLAGIALAIANLDDDALAPPTGPDAGAVGRLSALGGKGLAGLLARLGAPAARRGRFLLLAGEAEALFLGQTGGAAIAALVPASHAGAVVALWQATRDA